MTKQGLPILLILMMLITPIASAFEHCSAMAMSIHLSESPSMTVGLSTIDSSPLKHKTMLDDKANNPAAIDCHTASSCSFHVCGGYGLTSSSTTVTTDICSYYSSYKYPAPHSTALSPALRPPIVIL